MRYYRKANGQITLQEGHWLKNDRTRNTEIWKKANSYNLKLEDGNLRYQSISQIRDFYLWFENERIKTGNEVTYIGIAHVVADQLSKFDNGLIRFFIVHNKEVINFGNVASKKVFEFSFPQMREVYFSTQVISGDAAKKWDLNYGRTEQCVILEPIYLNLDQKTLNLLLKMAKGKGIYRLGVPKELRFDGNIKDCHDRVEHGLKKVYPYILGRKE